MARDDERAKGARAAERGAGEVLFRALGVALLASVPTALRTAGAGGGFGDGMLLGAGVLLPLVTLAMVLARQAGRGFRQLAGARPPRAAAFGLALWIGLATPLLIALGAALKATTHHRGLAGATFGALGLGVLAGSAILAHRLVLLGRSAVDRGAPAWIVAAAGAAIGVLPLVVVASPLGLAESGAAAAVRSAILDGVIVMVATSLASTLELRPRVIRLARTLGLPVALLVLVGAGARAETAPSAGRAFEKGGGLAATLLSAVTRFDAKEGASVPGT